MNDTPSLNILIKMNGNLKVVTDNYKAGHNMVKEIGLDVENAFDFDKTLNANFEFCHCGLCDRPILGHRAEKCSKMNGETYDAALVRIFENKVRNREGFRLIVRKHIQRK